MSKEKRDDAAHSQTTALLDPHTLNLPTLEEVAHYVLYYCRHVHFIVKFFLVRNVSTFVNGQKKAISLLSFISIKKTIGHVITVITRSLYTCVIGAKKYNRK